MSVVRGTVVHESGHCNVSQHSYHLYGHSCRIICIFGSANEWPCLTMYLTLWAASVHRHVNHTKGSKVSLLPIILQYIISHMSEQFQWKYVIPGGTLFVWLWKHYWKAVVICSNTWYKQWLHGSILYKLLCHRVIALPCGNGNKRMWRWVALFFCVQSSVQSSGRLRIFITLSYVSCLPVQQCAHMAMNWCPRVHYITITTWASASCESMNNYVGGFYPLCIYMHVNWPCCLNGLNFLFLSRACRHTVR